MNLYKRNEHIQNGIINASQKKLYGPRLAHGHDFFEIEYIIDGYGTYIIDGTEYPVQRNMLFFMSPASFHATGKTDAEIINVMFPCTLCDMAPLFQLFSNKVNTVLLPEADCILVEKLLEEIVSASQNGNTAYAVQFLRCLLYKLTTVTPAPKQPVVSHIQSAIVYIMENFRKNITLPDTADYVGIVPAYLSTLFLQETGMNFKTYVDNLRFDYAIKLLTFTKISIAEVCVQSGFSDYANFNRRFKEKFELTPKAYRMAYWV